MQCIFVGYCIVNYMADLLHCPEIKQACLHYTSERHHTRDHIFTDGVGLTSL